MDIDKLDFAMVLTNKLTAEELSTFCDYWDDGNLENIVNFVLIPRDKENNPTKYKG